MTSLYRVLIALILLFSVLLAAGLSGCGKDEPIRIGFSGGLTGRHADLGLYGRNGVLLAFEEINFRGAFELLQNAGVSQVVMKQLDREMLLNTVAYLLVGKESSN